FFSTDGNYGVAYGNGKFVTVGHWNSSGKIAYSENGMSWQTATITGSGFFDTDQNIRGVAYGGGKWVAVGPTGQIAYSENGTSWEVVDDSTFNDSSVIDLFGVGLINGVAYGNGKWVAVGLYGKMAYCAD
ncbi:MAG: hypothetical protein LBG72_00510, partial [Spirochaetaceae bacterium]|nr:hypothetical protein [Spirochaetaceae bacterium]